MTENREQRTEGRKQKQEAGGGILEASGSPIG